MYLLYVQKLIVFFPQQIRSASVYVLGKTHNGYRDAK